jgi:hypothetical protein
VNVKREFLLKAIAEVQETNRFLDTKAGVIVMFESSLFLILVSSLLDVSRLQLIPAFVSQAATEYLILLTAYLTSYVIALVVHVLVTLRVIFPKQNPESCVKLDDFQPKKLFFLHKLDQNGRMEPSVPEYYAELATLSDDEVDKEYVFEFIKLSYIRKIKYDGLARSFKFLNILVIGAAVFGLLVAFGMLIY